MREFAVGTEAAKIKQFHRDGTVEDKFAVE
jgi:hypothetical protein